MIPESLSAIPEPFAAALHRRGFTELTPVQQAVVAAIGGEEDGADWGQMQVRDLRISSQTGSGKTVAIGLALAPHFLAQTRTARATEALLIVPTRELVTQLRDELRWLYAGLDRVHVEGVMGGASLLRERSALSRRPAIVVATPGRLLDHIRAGVLACEDVGHVVLDEADRMLDMGFRDELEAILDALPTPRSSHMLSATFPGSVRRLADRFQSNALRVEGTPADDAHPDIAHVAHLVNPREAYAALINLLLGMRGMRCLVFVQRRIDAAEIAEKLAADGFAASPLSGDLPQAQRTRTLNAFRAGTVEILVATDVAARGIDVPDISTVIHTDTPFDADTYVHRSGRTGRAGQQGRSLMLVPTSQERRIRRLISSAGISVAWEPVPDAKRVLKAARKNMRRELWRRLDAADGPDEAQLEYAATLLETRDPKELVAALLVMATPELPCAPRSLSPIAPRAAAREGKHQQDFATFSISWGHRKGATASRLLSQVCRRGGVPGHRVGSIRIESNHSIFQIARDVADAFEARAKRPDSRDPGVRIERTEEAIDGPGASRRAPAAPRRRRTGRAHDQRGRPARFEGRDSKPRRTAENRNSD